MTACTQTKMACDEVVDQFLRINNIVADHKMTFMERASLRSECRKLTRFLKLIDFLVMDTMRNVALDSVKEVVTYIKPPVPPVRDIRYQEVDLSLTGSIHRASMTGRGSISKEKKSTPLFSVRANFDQDGRIFISPSSGELRKLYPRVCN